MIVSFNSAEIPCKRDISLLLPFQRLALFTILIISNDLILSLLENIRLDIWDPKYGQLYQEM